MLKIGFLHKYKKRYALYLSPHPKEVVNLMGKLTYDDLFLVISKTIAQDLVEKVLVVTSRNNIGWIDLLEDEYEILIHNE